MKPYIKFAAVATAALIGCSGGAYAAAEDSYSVTYGNDTKELTLYAETNQPSAHVTVSVAAYDKGTAFSSDNIPLFLYVYDTDEKGVLSQTIKLSPSYGSGKYNVCAYYGTLLTEQIMILNENDPATKAAVGEINNCASVAELLEILKKPENKYIFGVDLSVIGDIPESAAEYCFAERGDSGFTPASFSQTLSKAVVIAQISAGEDTERILRDNAAQFGTTAEALDKITGTQKDILLSLIKNADYSKETPEQIFAEKLLVSEAASVESMSALRTVLENNAAAFGIDISQGSAYMSIVSDKKISVFGYMLGGNENFTSYGDVKKSFDAAVQKVKSEQSQGGGSSSGSGGRGISSPGGGTSYVLPSDNGNSGNNDNKSEKFSDINESWAKEYIESLSGKNMINGFPDGTFRPNDTVTRAELSKMICTLLGLNGGDISGKFADVSAADWFSPYVAACADKGIVTGYDGRFEPNGDVTREDCAVMACRALGIAPTDNRTAFVDDDSISDYAKGAVSALSDKNIIVGGNGLFRAKDKLSRAEAAAILCRLSDALS